jgi:iron complex outermembrane recepter protein
MKIRALILYLLASSLAFADDIRQLSPTVVTATRIEENSFDLPVSIDVIEQKDIKDGQLTQYLSESLIRVPGISAQNRYQAAQDTQIQTRGFGARSAFGVRGIRIYVDGFSVTNPDGIGNPGNIDISTLKSIEVMRGPFSALYGSSSGGVIQLRTEDIPIKPEATLDFKIGSFGTTSESIKYTGTLNDIGYYIDSGAYNTAGYRDQSATHKNQTTAKLKFDLFNGAHVEMLADYMNLHGKDPSGLTNNQFTQGSYNLTDYSAFSDPKKAPSVATLEDTKVHKENTQVGLKISYDINENNAINLINNVGHRINEQRLSTSATTYASKTSSIGRDFFNNEANITNKGQLFGFNYNFTTGLMYGSLADQRCDVASKLTTIPQSGYMACTAAEANLLGKVFASNLDEYIQGKISLSSNLDIHAGVRNTNVNYDIQSQISATRSGSSHFSKSTPMVGAVWKLNTVTNFYANYGKGFETPTTAEIIYSAGGLLTPNLSLAPSTSDNYEIGVKTFLTNSVGINFALFKTNTENEIVTHDTTSGNTSYMNASKTSRQGIEASVNAKLDHNLSIYGAYTFLDAQFDSSYSYVVNKVTNVVTEGNKIPGTYRQQIFGEVAWKYPELNFKTAIEARYNSKVYATDTNINTVVNFGNNATAPSYTVFNLRAGFDQNINSWKISEFLKVENLFDKQYIGSVRINDSNARYFEPSPGRNYLIGFNTTYQF